MGTVLFNVFNTYSISIYIIGMAASGGYKPRCFMDIEIDGKAGNTFFSEQSKRAMVLINNISYF